MEHAIHVGADRRTGLYRDQRGLSTMEYAVLFVIIVVGAIGLWSTLGEDLANQLGQGTDTVEEVLGQHNEGGGQQTSGSKGRTRAPLPRQ